jgi:putative ABC transport system ATP-binding protein
MTLELREVTKRYRSGGQLVTAADGISATVSRGELVALYGPSGSGKTTTLMLAAGIEQPDAGAVLFDGVNLAGFTRREGVLYRRRSIGLVAQTMYFNHGLSVIDNASMKLVAEGMTLRKARARTLPLFDLVGLSDRTEARPSDLSPGEAQRVAIVQALSNGPDLILADEPTGNLDSHNGATVLDLLADICRNRTVAGLLVTHDPQAARFATRALTLIDGKLRAGVYAETLSVAGEGA